jgi:L-threonylcarbamoyladenylate synthase
VIVVAGNPEQSAKFIQSKADENTGVICFDEFAELFSNQTVEKLGSVHNKAQQAHQVFDALRAFDSTSVNQIYAQCPDPAGLGLAVENRLKKAAGFHVVTVE